MKLRIIGIVGLFLAAGLSAPAWAQFGGPASVFTERVKPLDFSDRVEAIGSLAPNERVDLTVNAADRVTGVYFEDGERVRKGQTLLTQAQGDQRAAIESAEATLKEAQNVVDRMQPLVEEGAVSRLQFDESKRNVAVAEAALTSVQIRQRERVLVAPFAGLVGFRQVSAGSYLRPGDIVTTLIDDSVMMLELPVPASFLSSVGKGLEISATTSSLPGKTFTGKLVSLDNEIDRVTRSLRVRAELPNPDLELKPGMFMSVTLYTSPRTSLAVPEESIQPLGSKSYVYVVEQKGGEKIARRHEVQPGSRLNGMVEIVSGLVEDDEVITEGIIGVREGSPVVVRPKSLLTSGGAASNSSTNTALGSPR